MNKWIPGVTLVWRLSVWYSTKIDNLQLQKWRLSRQVIESAIQPIQNIKEKHFLRYCIVHFWKPLQKYHRLSLTHHCFLIYCFTSSLFAPLLLRSWRGPIWCCIRLNRIVAWSNNSLATGPVALDRVEIKKPDLILLESFREGKIALSYRNVV